MCVGGGGGGGGGEGEEEGEDNFLYMAKYGCACRMAPFFSVARYMITDVRAECPHFSALPGI